MARRDLDLNQGSHDYRPSCLYHGTITLSQYLFSPSTISAAAETRREPSSSHRRPVLIISPRLQAPIHKPSCTPSSSKPGSTSDSPTACVSQMIFTGHGPFTNLQPVTKSLSINKHHVINRNIQPATESSSINKDHATNPSVQLVSDKTLPLQRMPAPIKQDSVDMLTSRLTPMTGNWPATILACHITAVQNGEIEGKTATPKSVVPTDDPTAVTGKSIESSAVQSSSALTTSSEDPLKKTFYATSRHDLGSSNETIKLSESGSKTVVLNRSTQPKNVYVPNRVRR